MGPSDEQQSNPVNPLANESCALRRRAASSRAVPSLLTLSPTLPCSWQRGQKRNFPQRSGFGICSGATLDGWNFHPPGDAEMETYFTVKRALLVLGLLAMPALAGCQTTAGFGRDVQSTGRWIEGGAQDTQAWMFGLSAQAAEAKTPAARSEQAITPAAGNSVVYFKTGSAEVPPDGLEVIRAIANDSKQSTGKIEVTGYSDTAGSSGYNDQLSHRRAEAVADELTAQGLRRESIVVAWHGEDQLPVPTGDGVPEPQNRRVSIDMTEATTGG